MADARPLVSVGVPVRNGGATLDRVLEGLVTQSYANLEIVISDNASSDTTADLGRRMAARDPRVRYVRHEQPIPVLDNYRFAFRETHGELFMWAAHDDFRSPNYVETLVDAFRRHPEASLAASDFVEFDREEDALRQPRIPHDFETAGLGLVARFRKHTRIGCDHVYGLLNARYIRDYRWREDVGWDVAFLAFLAVRGPFVYTPGATFYYHRTPTQTIETRARETSFRRVRSFQTARTAWVAASAVSDASRQTGRRRPAVLVFPVALYFFMQGVRGMVASMMTRPIRAALRRLAGSSHA
jgi:glycosyltransferase involved in cell wall biosynthesis